MTDGITTRSPLTSILQTVSTKLIATFILYSLNQIIYRSSENTSPSFHMWLNTWCTVLEKITSNSGNRVTKYLNTCMNIAMAIIL